MDQNGQPCAIEPLVPETEDDLRHQADAIRRRDERLRLAGRA